LSLVVQIVLALLLLGGLIAPFIANKYWHWSQTLLVICVELAGVGVLFLGAETVRTHHILRKDIPQLEKNVVAAEKQNEVLIHGSGDTPGVLDLEHQLQMISRDRGRVWRRVMPVGEVGNDGQIEVEITQPKPHGLAAGAIVFAFEDSGQIPQATDDSEEFDDSDEFSEEEVPADEGEEVAADAAAPAGNRQYLGEFRVVEATETGVALEPVLLINQRTGQRLVDSQGPWSLYEAMPTDRHRIFAGMDEEQLRRLLPGESVEEYVRHGSPAVPADNEFNRVGLDENDQPVESDKAVKFIYDRPLRDYAYIFADLAQQRVFLQASKQAVTEDNTNLAESIKSGERLGEFRKQQIQALTADREGMVQDRQAIEAYLNQVGQQLASAKQLIEQTLADNSKLANQLTEQQMSQLQLINSSAPAPPGAEAPAP